MFRDDKSRDAVITLVDIIFRVFKSKTWSTRYKRKQVRFYILPKEE